MTAGNAGGEILFIAHRIPFPPDRGDKIRSHHILKALAGIAPVHVACFADDELDAREEPALAALAASYRMVRRSKPLPLAGLEALAKGCPVSLTAFHHRALADYVRETLATRPISTIYVFSGQMGQYVPADFAGRFLMDFVDVDSAKFDAYGQTKTGPMRWVDAREGRLLRAEEARLAARANASLLISANEAALFAHRLPAGHKAHVAVVGNGIDSAFFAPDAAAPAPQLAALAGPRFIFTGQMDYAPNIAAAARVAHQIMPLIRQAHPQASFHVVGRAPTEAVKALHGVHGTHVWGRVDDVRCWLKGADIALVPLDIARGIQNKVLEAMAMELPVVLTSGAANGIDAAPNRDFAVADSDEDLAAAAIALASDPAAARAMGLAARGFVEAHQSWHAALARLAEIVDAR